MSTEPHSTVVSPTEARETSSLSSRRGVAILLLLCLVQFMDVLDASILNIALPSSVRSRAEVARALYADSPASERAATRL